MIIPRLLLLGLLLALPVALSAQGSPDFQFKQSWNTPQGFNKLSDYRGQVVLLEVWATW